MDPVIESANVRGKIIVLKDTVADVNAAASDLSLRYRIVRENVYKDVLKGFNTGLITDAQCEAILGQNPTTVECILDDFEVTAYGQIIPWNIRRIGTTDAGCSAGIGTHGPEKTAHVFVLDTGCGPCSDINIVESRSFIRSEGDGRDFHGHGTAVASIIGARDNDQLTVGIAPGARIHSYKVLDKTGVGQMSGVLAALEALIQWKRGHLEVKNGVIVNMSFGAFVGISESALDRAVLSLEREGITSVVAAGNHGAMTALYSPARAKEAMTVAAYDKENKTCAWSNYGPEIDVFAPGSGIMALYKNNKLAVVSGTSMASAHVAGAAALFLSIAPHCTPDQVRLFLRDKSQFEHDGANPRIINTPADTINQSIYVREY